MRTLDYHDRPEPAPRMVAALVVIPVAAGVLGFLSFFAYERGEPYMYSCPPDLMFFVSAPVAILGLLIGWWVLARRCRLGACVVLPVIGWVLFAGYWSVRALREYLTEPWNV